MVNYGKRRGLRSEKLEEVIASDYLENVLLDIGLNPELKRFERLTRCVRILAAEYDKPNGHYTATDLYRILSAETGDAPRWINKQIALAIQGAYRSGCIFKFNDYVGYRLIDSDTPIGNYLFICELYRVLLLKAVDEVKAIKDKQKSEQYRV